ncbi:MAG: hypothetical protein AW07_04165 [Candidatus Accumulibacter sp. SK-11]|nr:MAG: hypothetical protein AW07_04165 [Candidatus Accumulibacter sp. SK-11]
MRTVFARSTLSFLPGMGQVDGLISDLQFLNHLDPAARQFNDEGDLILAEVPLVRYVHEQVRPLLN